MEDVHVNDQLFSTQEIAESFQSWLLRVWNTCCVHGIDLDQGLEILLTLFDSYSLLVNPPTKYANNRTSLRIVSPYIQVHLRFQRVHHRF